MSNQTKSEVEIYWDAIRAKSGDNRSWQQLSPRNQEIVIQSINALLFVLGDE